MKGIVGPLEGIVGFVLPMLCISSVGVARHVVLACYNKCCVQSLGVTLGGSPILLCELFEWV